MAKEVIINLEAKTDEAIKGIQETKKEIQDLNKEVTKGNKDTVDGFKAVEGAGTVAAGGIRKISSSIKALGIGLLIAAFAKFTEVLNENQRVTDFFNTTFEVLSLAFNDFFNFVFDNVGGVVDAFKSIFENPLQSILNFRKSITEGIIQRFKEMLEVVGFVGDAIQKVFKGDFAGAAESAKNAGKGLLDVVTGVDDSFDKTVETVGKVAEATKNYVTETIKAGKANVELTKQAEIARVRQQGLVESFDLQAEKLRQVRDEERNTIEDRIKANNDLAKVLDQQEEAMLKQVDMQIKAAQAEFDKNKNQENTIALLEAQQEKEAVLAQIAGFRSEQKSNDLALDRELIELTNSKLESEANLGIERKRINASKIEDDLKRLEREKEIDLEEETLQRNRLQRIVDEANAGTQAKVDAQIALDEFEVEMSQKKLDREKEISEQEKIILDARLKAQIGFAQAVGNVVGALGGLLQEGTNASKAAALADIIIKTGVGFAQGLDIAQKTAAGTGPAAAFAFPIFYASQIAAVLSTVSQAKQILSKVKGGGASIGGDISGGGRGVSTPSAPSFNIVGSDPQTQLADAIGQQVQKPVKAFVVAGDVSTAQSLDRNIIQESSLG
tara:strand:+ start:1592 stop:3430 length:1839 start_codon:yes stop_codon:yes gene_type:complete